MEDEKKRERLPDVLRGFAALLVVFGHCIQEGSGAAFSQNTAYFDNRIYQLIYSFHMPLFMMISGYLAWNGMKYADSVQAKRRLCRKRAFTLLFPILFWTTLEFGIWQLVKFMQGSLSDPALKILQKYGISLLTNFWFLWAVWWCFILTFLIHFFCKDAPVVWGCVFLLTFVTPDGLGLGADKYMLPFFVLPFYAHAAVTDSEKNTLSGRIREWLQKHMVFSMTAVGAAFAVLYCFMDRSTLIYLTGYKLIGKTVFSQLLTDLFRTAIGFAGCLFVILAGKMLMIRIKRYSFPILCRLGRDSMGIYILSGYLILYAVRPITKNMQPSYLVNFAEAVIVAAISTVMTELLGRIPGLCRTVGLHTRNSRKCKAGHTRQMPEKGGSDGL